MRILLMGTPNVGKSALFSRLTGARVLISNYSGTTVEFYKGIWNLEEGEAELIDVPGTYSLSPSNKAEEVASEILEKGDVIINVVDATNLERDLFFTRQLLQTGKPLLLVLNMWDVALSKKINIDVKKLESLLDIPIVTTCALTGEGIDELKSKVKEAKSVANRSCPGSDQEISEILKLTEEKPKQDPDENHFFSFDYYSVHPITGPFIALLVLFLSFSFVALAGNELHEILESVFIFLWLPVVEWVSGLLSRTEWIHSILIGTLINGNIHFEESFGLLTTGLYIPLAVVLPYIFCFYVMLSLLEDIGYLPRLGLVIDNLMQRLGIQGLSIVPLMLGIGCNVPGVMAGRMLETKRERFIVATLIAICVPCMAQQAMVIGLLGQAGVWGLLIVYLFLFLIWLVLGFILNFFVKGQTSEMLIDLPRYQMPYWPSLTKKVYMRMNGFIRHALPYVLLGVFIVNLLYSFGFIQFVSHFFAPVITTLFGLPGEAGGALIVGFLRKDVAIGMLAPLGMELSQLMVASLVLMVYFPCVATFVVIFKELGLSDLIKLSLIMVLVVVLAGSGLHLLLQATGF